MTDISTILRMMRQIYGVNYIYRPEDKTIILLDNENRADNEYALDQATHYLRNRCPEDMVITNENARK